MEPRTDQGKLADKFAASFDFLPFIESIRFPMYKSLEDELTIKLNWPIVALIGPNGTNKSSILQALASAPEGRSLAQFWFSTPVDDIDRGLRGKADHRFIYTYRFDSSGVRAECRKYRGSKLYRASDVPAPLKGKRDPDYWEPTKRVQSDGMAEIPETGYDGRLSGTRDRWNQIDKDVVYLDFRSELSAFDKFIHHQAYSYWTPDDTRKRYRAVIQSRLVARALAGRALPAAEAAKLIDPVRLIDPKDVQTISEIIGKPVDTIAIVNHRFFGPQGSTIRFRLKNSGASYSEAHAGSGEYAVVRMVDAISRTKPRSLILLDEPEVSLHPAAQARLMRFIEREVLRHAHQVVISTHSPSLVADLPAQAIKVLGYDRESQRVILVADGCSPTEAFAHLGYATTAATRPRVFVEDETASEVVKASLRIHNPTKLDSIDIVTFPGGADGIIRNILPALAISGDVKTAILLDGDQRRTDHTRLGELFGDNLVAKLPSELSNLIELWTARIHKTTPNLYSDSDHNKDIAHIRKCIQWAVQHLGFLPGSNPEQLVAEGLRDDAQAPGGDWKEYWRQKTRSDRKLTVKEAAPAAMVLGHLQAEIGRVPADYAAFKDVAATIDALIDW